jgi:hypothetical protein
MTIDVEDRLFEPFFTTRPAGTGSGLGLTIVQRIVQEHHGWIDVITRPGSGSTFTIGLPAIPDPAPPNHEAIPGSGLVLVAHPVAHVRDLICGALVAEGYLTLTASTRADLATTLAQHGYRVDLAVVDAQLVVPAPSSGSFLPLGLRVVVIGNVVDRAEFEGNDHVVFLGEPLALAALTASVGQLLRSSDLLVGP